MNRTRNACQAAHPARVRAHPHRGSWCARRYPGGSGSPSRPSGGRRPQRRAAWGLVRKDGVVAKTTVTELKAYIEDIETGVALWWNDANARLERIEADIAIIKEHLVTRMRASEKTAETKPPSQ